MRAIPSRAAACEMFPALCSNTPWRYWRIASSGVMALGLPLGGRAAERGPSAPSGSSIAPVITAASVNKLIKEAVQA